MVQCIIAACIGGLEFCFPALFVDTFNTFEVRRHSQRRFDAKGLSGLTCIAHPVVPCRFGFVRGVASRQWL